MPNSKPLPETAAKARSLPLAQQPESQYFCTPIEARFDRLTRVARQALRVPVAAITFLNYERQWFKSVTGWAVTDLSHDQSFCPLTLAARSLTIFEDTRRIAELEGHPLVESGPRFRFYAGIPIKDEHANVCGTFCIFDKQPRQLSADEVATLRDLAAMTEREIFGDRARSVRTKLAGKLSIARRQSMMDPLTRLWNRRGASVVITGALAEAALDGSQLAVAILDLENFRHINETYGHQVGDEVLRKSAMRLTQSIRLEDNVCRIGSDEFLVLMRNVDSLSARQTTERLRQAIVDQPIATQLGPIRVSTSVGYTVRQIEPETTVNELVQEAEQAVRESRSSGLTRAIEAA